MFGKRECSNRLNSMFGRKQPEDTVQPKWISFFDGAVYQDYQNFVQTRDFSKTQLAKSAEDSLVHNLKNLSQLSTIPQGKDLYTLNQEIDYNEIPSNRSLPLTVIYPTKEEEKARRRTTRTYVVLGILVLSLVAMLVAVLFHFSVKKSILGESPRQPGETLMPSFQRPPLLRRPALTTVSSVS